ncbi:hypothetical protein OOT00_14075 [Desulfobotulus sp. H1]|uniref:Uncharacterized protein n=1 Tax=Desulfobotulus pelophilus TaxID=2823377 RepID=A0ABT3NCC5_9BACT|nr:hypothetical protein [Desulfobotulus pelophilus]MCW7755111.1 hypothetical protein [Desulfobotulus pelophilus]
MLHPVFSQYMQASICQQKTMYGRYIDSLVMIQAEMEKNLAHAYADFHAIPPEVLDMMQDMGLRMNAFRSTYKKLVNAQFDYCMGLFGGSSGK